MPSCGVRPSVYMGVCHVRVFCRNSQIFSTAVATSFYFSIPSIMAIFWWGPPRGVEFRWGMKKSAFSTSISLSRVLSTLGPPAPDVINTVPPDRGKLVTLIAGSSKRRRLLMTGDGRRNVHDKKPQRYAEDNKTVFNCYISVARQYADVR